MGKIAINIATGSLQKEEIIVGIDLGTTNSLVAIMHPESKKAVALREHNSSSLVPSIIHFTEQGTVVVGDAAKEKLASHPASTIYSVKRL
ncbi:MAG: heat-shock protein Hsp70, partial [Bacteroidetes bacterium]